MVTHYSKFFGQETCVTRATGTENIPSNFTSDPYLQSLTFNCTSEPYLVGQVGQLSSLSSPVGVRQCTMRITQRGETPCLSTVRYCLSVNYSRRTVTDLFASRLVPSGRRLPDPEGLLFLVGSRATVPVPRSVSPCL